MSRVNTLWVNGGLKCANTVGQVRDDGGNAEIKEHRDNHKGFHAATFDTTRVREPENAASN